MKTWKKIILIASALLVLAAAVVAYAFYQHITQTIPDCYAQWSAAELVILYRQEQGKMPSQWTDLQSIFDSKLPLHHGGLSFEGIQSRIHIDFPSLPKLEQHHSDATLPEVITTTSGTSAHWSNAEPNQLVYEELAKKQP